VLGFSSKRTIFLVLFEGVMSEYRGFYDSNQMNHYLSASVIRLGTLPVYIVHAGFAGPARCILTYVPVGDTYEKRTEVSLNALDLTPVSLGFLVRKVPSKKGIGAIFKTSIISRLPIRAWKIGLSNENIRVDILNETGDREYESILVSKELRDTINGKYCNLQEAKTLLSLEGISGIIPFHRHFALEKSNKGGFSLLHYRHKKVPIGEINGDGVSLNKSFRFLNEALEEVLDGQRKAIPSNI